MLTNTNVQPTVLHTVGSVDNKRLFKTSILYASACKDFGQYHFEYVAIYPNGEISNPRSLETKDLECAVRYHFHKIYDIISSIKPDVIIHHTFGNFSCTNLRASLELLKIPIIGSPAEIHYIANNKASTRALLCQAGVSIAPGIHLAKGDDKDYSQLTSELEYPVIVKAATVEDSMGVFRVMDPENLTNTINKAFELSNTVVIEKFIRGHELRCCVIEDESHKKVVLPILKYGIGENDIRTFDKKLVINSDGRMEKAKCDFWYLDECKSSKEIKAVEKVSLKAFSGLGIKDFAIFDIRMDKNGVPYILEVNLFCSFGTESILNMAARKFEITGQRLLEIMVKRSMKCSTKNVNESHMAKC